MSNPFSLSFGTRPAELIERPVQASEITESFLSEYVNQRTYGSTFQGEERLDSNSAQSGIRHDPFFGCETEQHETVL